MAVEEENEAAPDFDDPLALLGGMGEEEVYKVSLLDGALAQDSGAESKALPLESFLYEVESLLIDPEPSAPSTAPAPPGNLGSAALEAECAALARLVARARGGELAVLLADEWLAGELGAALARSAVAEAVAEGVPEFRARLATACATFVAKAPEGVAEVRRLGLLLVAVASLQLYLRCNWTGPHCEDSGPFCTVEAQVGSQADLGILEALEVDGEPAYELIVGPGHLLMALDLLASLPESASAAHVGGRTVPLWRGRAAFIWQLSLADASERGVGQSPTLFKQSICDLLGTDTGRRGALAGDGLISGDALAQARATVENVLKSWRAAEDAGGSAAADSAEADAATTALAVAPPRSRSAVVTEMAVRLCWYGRTKPFDAVLAAACAAVGFNFEVTGVMGIKRVYQTVEFAQLMCKAGTLTEGAKECGGGGGVGAAMAPKGDGEVPGNLTLLECDDMTDVLEQPKISDEIGAGDRALLERPLTATEQVILLARCHWLWVSFNPEDEMTLQEVNALAQRVLQTDEAGHEGDVADGKLHTANWLSFSCGLWYRCKAEHHRNKTRERAAFQLQSLVDQFKDEKPSAAHRLLVVHSAGYPARFHLQREMGMRMMKFGMVSTAHEQFKKLRMWPEAVECLMVAERNVEAEEMIKEQLAIQESPRLWCCLGDVERKPEHWEKAWALSKGRFARAQRSLGRHLFREGKIAEAIESFKLALDINPLHSGIWFTKGVGEMRLDRMKDAVQTFSRCVGVEDENSEAWANLGAAHTSLGNLREARSCITEACRRNRNSWKMWESFLGICMQLRDMQGVIQAMRQLADLDQTLRIPERVIGMVTMAVVTDAEGLYNGTRGRAHSDQLNNLFKFMTQKFATIPCLWRFWAELQEVRGEPELALESRLKQNRASQAKLWEELDADKFGTLLGDLRECLEVAAERFRDPKFAELARQHQGGLSLSVRDIEKRLRGKIDSCHGAAPADWVEELGKLKALGDRLDALHPTAAGAA